MASNKRHIFSFFAFLALSISFGLFFTNNLPAENQGLNNYSHLRIPLYFSNGGLKDQFLKLLTVARGETDLTGGILFTDPDTGMGKLYNFLADPNDWSLDFLSRGQIIEEVRMSLIEAKDTLPNDLSEAVKEPLSFASFLVDRLGPSKKIDHYKLYHALMSYADLIKGRQRVREENDPERLSPMGDRIALEAVRLKPKDDPAKQKELSRLFLAGINKAKGSDVKRLKKAGDVLRDSLKDTPWGYDLFRNTAGFIDQVQITQDKNGIGGDIKMVALPLGFTDCLEGILAMCGEDFNAGKAPEVLDRIIATVKNEYAAFEKEIGYDSLCSLSPEGNITDTAFIPRVRPDGIEFRISVSKAKELTGIDFNELSNRERYGIYLKGNFFADDKEAKGWKYPILMEYSEEEKCFKTTIVPNMPLYFDNNEAVEYNDYQFWVADRSEPGKLKGEKWFKDPSFGTSGRDSVIKLSYKLPPALNKESEYQKLAGKNILQLNLDAECPQGSGKFRWLKDNLGRFKEEGYDNILLVGSLMVPSDTFSPYEIVGYYFNPGYGDDNDFMALVKAGKKNGIDIIVDFVSAHTGKNSSYSPFPDESYVNSIDDTGHIISVRNWGWRLSDKSGRVVGEWLWQRRRLAGLGVTITRNDVQGAFNRFLWWADTMLNKHDNIAEWEKPKDVPEADMLIFKGLRNEFIASSISGGSSSFPKLKEILYDKLRSLEAGKGLLLSLDDRDENYNKGTAVDFMGRDASGDYNRERFKANYMAFYMLHLLNYDRTSVLEYSGARTACQRPVGFLFGGPGYVDFKDKGFNDPDFSMFSRRLRNIAKEIVENKGRVEEIASDNYFSKTLQVYVNDKRYELNVNLSQQNWKADIKEYKIREYSVQVGDTDNIVEALPSCGGYILKAFEFLKEKGLLKDINRLTVIEGHHESSAVIKKGVLTVKLPDVSLFEEKFANESFLYFVYLLASPMGRLQEKSDYASGFSESEIISVDENGFNALMFKDTNTGEIFVLAANFNTPSNNNNRYFSPLTLPRLLFGKENKNYIVTSSLVQDGLPCEQRIRKYQSAEGKIDIGLPKGGCQIFKFKPRSEILDFKAGDIPIFGLPGKLSKVIALFANTDIHQLRDIWRINITRGSQAHVVSAITSSRELEVCLPPADIDVKPSDIIKSIADVFGITNLAGLKKTVRKYKLLGINLEDLLEDINYVQEKIKSEGGPKREAIRRVWDYKKKLYRDMVKPRLVDKKYKKWVKENAPLLQDKLIVSWQKEMGSHPELSLALLEVFEEEVKNNNMSLEEADILLKKVPMSNMAGGLGALMPDLLRALADNGANVVSLNLLYGRYKEDGTPTAKWLIKALKKMGANEKSYVVNHAELGRPVEVDVYICKLGEATEVWITGLDVLYASHTDSSERAQQVKYCNYVGQAVLKSLRKERIIPSLEILNLENESYVYLPKEGDSVAINHSIVKAASPKWPGYLFEYLRKDYGDKIFDKEGNFKPEVLGIKRACRVLGVSKDHTEISKERYFVDALKEVGIVEGEEKKELLAKIVMDEKYGSSNGTHPKHFQAPEIQDMIEKHKEELGDIAMDDEELIERDWKTHHIPH